ncbi:MAG: hypothetical protein SCK70_16535 [bacterium]|nr:hypothetical protein [bacterium]
MSDQNDIIYDSPASAPDDAFWLEQGRKMVTGSLSGVRSAASSLISALGVIKAIYFGILGFAEFIPENWSIWGKCLFITPLLIWLIALYCCVQVVMTQKLILYLHSPEHIQRIYESTIMQKQRQLEWYTVGIYDFVVPLLAMKGKDGFSVKQIS